MRITQNYSIESLLRQVNQSRDRISTLQRNLATGKRINTISDDPEHIEIVMRYQKLLKTHQRFEKNISGALDFMYITSQTLDDAVDIMSYSKELALQGDGSLDSDEWGALAEQVNQQLKQMVNIANTRFDHRYVFGGEYPTEQPFYLSSDETQVTTNSNGITGDLKIEYGESQIDKYNVTGEDAFLGDVDVFRTLIDLRDAFVAQDETAVQGLLDTIDQSVEQLVQVNGRLGARINRFELNLQQYESHDARLQEFLSNVEDTDVPRAITELQLEETGLTTALQVLSRTLNISLVDFMG